MVNTDIKVESQDGAILHWLYHFSSQGVIVTDLNLNITGWNQWMEIHTGKNVSSVMGKKMADIYPELHQRRMDQMYEKVLDGQVVILSQRLHSYLLPMPVKYATLHFTKMQQTCRLAPLISDHKVIGTLTIIEDVTDRILREKELVDRAAELARSNADLEQFAHIASHDLKEPLNKISAFSGLLLDRIVGRFDEKELSYFGRIQNSIQRMRKLIDDILSYSKIGVVSNNNELHDPRLAIDQVLVDLEIRIAESGAVVEVGDLSPVRASGVQLHQLFLNLISNSIKFAKKEEKPIIKIRRVASGQGKVAIEITDNGIGFQQKYTDLMFMPFRRLHSQSAYEGSGIGLATCKRIVELNGGTISASSRLGEGASFIIVLPG